MTVLSTKDKLNCFMYCSQSECGIHKLNGCYHIFEYLLREIFDKVTECCSCMKFTLLGTKCTKSSRVKVKLTPSVNHFTLETSERGGSDESDGTIPYSI